MDVALNKPIAVNVTCGQNTVSGGQLGQEEYYSHSDIYILPSSRVIKYCSVGELKQINLLFLLNRINRHSISYCYKSRVQP